MPALVVAAVLAAPATASAQEPLAIAREYLKQNAAQFGVTAADVADTTPTSIYVTASTGVTHVNLNQRYNQLDVAGGHVTVNVGADKQVKYAAGRLLKVAPPASTAATLDAVGAVESAADELGLEDPERLRVTSRRGAETTLTDGGISSVPIGAKLLWHHDGNALRLAYQVTIDDATDSHLWNVTIDARTGEELARDDWVDHDDLDQLEQRLGGEAEAEAPKLAKAFQTTFTLASPTPVNDGSAYRVIAWPAESPNDAVRSLIGNPADTPGSPYGWHDVNGVAGADFATTQGNNVHAYLDQDANNAPDYNSSPRGGAALRFDFPAELDEHAQNYREAAVTNLFYNNNMIHDVLHRFGFDEVAGNFQANNYNRGGGEGDYVRAEAQDGNGVNNANFGTPAQDGGTPRMQMYVWPGSTTTFGLPNALTIRGRGGAVYQAGWSRFTPAPTNEGLANRTLVYAGNGCNDAAYPASRPARRFIAVVDGGTEACTYLQRVLVAQSLGADAVVVAHNAEGAPPVLTGSMIDIAPVIPAVAVSQADGAAIKGLIAAGPAPRANLHKRAEHPGIRDGDLENGIIIHEYGHGVSNRLTGGPGINCLGGQEQAGEGWSDYLAISLLMDVTKDNPDGPRGMGAYALFQPNRGGPGIRPRPYSRNMEIQPFTYDSIKTGGWLNGTTLALPHGLGHGWAAVLYDMTWDLVDKYGFNPNVYGAWNSGGNLRAIQYVMDGLKFQGCFPGLVAARSAIIAAAQERSGGADTCTLWASFARRGLGYSAVQGLSADRNDNTEAFDTHPNCRRAFQGVTPEPAINTVAAGDRVQLRFTADGYRELDVFAKGSPYSRQVDCTTLQTVTPGQTTITPRPFPIPLVGELRVNDRGQYTFPWRTDAAWAGTCREVVATVARTGAQFRTYYRFT
ncbi:M36 family metallopeptidase [Solirubrobacter deserti]|uniref:M36 family metallopeptidase n=1 Tax=Solirubrobacter deserti TaxID=2282478 RepID=A0ABT4RTT1_9ACTN|nr:M36 family metallopeptidase [Solirubrobacter deserti]MDA0141984.1 M36 family metallopeptidase [Solirubrobacter deserti]